MKIKNIKEKIIIIIFILFPVILFIIIGYSVAYFTSTDRSDDNYIHIGQISKPSIEVRLFHMIGPSISSAHYAPWVQYVTNNLAKGINKEIPLATPGNQISDSVAREIVDFDNPVKQTEMIILEPVKDVLRRKSHSTSDSTIHCFAVIRNLKVKRKELIKLDVLKEKIRITMKENYIITATKATTTLSDFFIDSNEMSRGYLKQYKYENGKYISTNDTDNLDMIIADMHIDLTSPRVMTTSGLLKYTLKNYADKRAYLSNAEYEIHYDNSKDSFAFFKTIKFVRVGR